MSVPHMLTSAPLALLLACATETPEGPAQRLQVMSFAGSEWSEPVHLPAPVNSPYRELGASLSPDELSLYFGSDRPGGQGAFDIWVSHRACLECPWEEPVNLGPTINSPSGDGSPQLSHDGLLLFFSGSRAGGEGGEDIWVSRRTDPNDDLGWGPPVNLGPGVNTTANEGGATYVPALEGEGATLYFDRRVGDNNASTDILAVRISRDGKPLGPAALVPELNSTVLDGTPTIRADGREMFFWSNRIGGLGATDIWTARRSSPSDPWSAPENLGPMINTTGGDLMPRLSWDGRTLLFSAAATARPSLGFQDIWMTTRSPSGKEVP